MNKSNAKKIAETITFNQLQEMFNNAKNNIDDWTKVSSVNKSMTIGTTWNILFVGLKPAVINQKHALINMIWEFGDYLPDEVKITNKTKEKSEVKVTHQEPKF